MQGMITDLIQLPAKDRLQRVVNYAFGGDHHVGKITKTIEGNGYEWWKFSVASGIATQDSDELTKLVVASLYYGVRVELVTSGPRRIGFILHPRKVREGAFHEQIITPEKAVENFKASDKIHWINSAENILSK